MASAVNYLMNLPLQVLGFCFLQIKKLKKSNFSETPLDSFSSLWSFISSPTPRKKKSMSIMEELSRGEALGQALMVTKGLLLFWE